MMNMDKVINRFETIKAICDALDIDVVSPHTKISIEIIGGAIPIIKTERYLYNDEAKKLAKILSQFSLNLKDEKVENVDTTKIESSIMVSGERA